MKFDPRTVLWPATTATEYRNNSLAVADRPRDVSCLYVVNFNSRLLYLERSLNLVTVLRL